MTAKLKEEQKEQKETGRQGGREKRKWIIPDNTLLLAGRKEKEDSPPVEKGGYSSMDGNKLVVDFTKTVSGKHFSLLWKWEEDEGNLYIQRIKGSKNPIFYRKKVSIQSYNEEPRYPELASGSIQHLVPQIPKQACPELVSRVRNDEGAEYIRKKNTDDFAEKDSFIAVPGDVWTVGDVIFFVQVEERKSEREDEGKETIPLSEETFTWDSLLEDRDKNAQKCLIAVLKVQEILDKDLETLTFLKLNLDILRDLLSLKEEILLLRILPPAKHLTSLGSYIDIYDNAIVCTEHSCAKFSVRLVEKAMKSRCMEVYEWKAGSVSEEFTGLPGVTWVCCCPVETGDEERFAFYVMGFGAGFDRDRVAVVQLISSIASQYLKTKQLLRLKFQVGNFFSPSVRDILFFNQREELLKPRLSQAVTFFFDLRGFSKATEKFFDGGKVEEYYKVLSDVLSLVTQTIFEEEGTILDYQGDAVIACWGAPEPRKDSATRSVRASKKIMENICKLNITFSKELSSDGTMKCGIGIAMGDVMAGCLNAEKQMKYTLIGSVMNIASRLEGLTKHIGVPVMVTGDLVKKIKEEQGEENNCGIKEFLFRRIGRIQPAGMENSLEIHELVLEKELGGSGISAEKIEDYHKDLALFEKAGVWDESGKEKTERGTKQGNERETGKNLQDLFPIPDDPASCFMRNYINNINNNKQILHTDGIIRFDLK